MVGKYPKHIEGLEYEFHEDYVKFGCAKIAVSLINTLHDDLLLLNRRHSNDVNSNKDITAIKIGQGVFTIDQIKSIAQYYEKQ